MSDSDITHARRTAMLLRDGRDALEDEDDEEDHEDDRDE